MIGMMQPYFSEGQKHWGYRYVQGHEYLMNGRPYFLRKANLRVLLLREGQATDQQLYHLRRIR